MTSTKARLDLKTGAVILACAFGLSACGVRGEPEIPPPMWGGSAPEQKPAQMPSEPNEDDSGE